MEKKSSWLIIILLLLVGITSVYVAGTYAKYTSELAKKEVTAEIARWKFVEDNATTAYTVELDKTYTEETLVDGKIAPGTEGKFTIVLSAENTETGVEYTLDFDDIKPDFGAAGLAIDDVNIGGTTLDQDDQDLSVWTGHLDPGEVANVDVHWNWDYETSAAQDAIDTAIGEGDDDLSIKVTITGVQSEPDEA